MTTKARKPPWVTWAMVIDRHGRTHFLSWGADGVSRHLLSPTKPKRKHARK